MIWYFPSHDGDFRLSQHPDRGDWSSLEIVDPTIDEQRILGEFLQQAHALGWTTKLLSSVPKKRRKVVRLRAAISVAGKLLVKLFKPGDQSLTAIKYDDRSLVTVVESADAPALESATAPAKEPKKAVTVNRPTPCCPNCIPGSVDRASEVLLSFLTPEQHAQWAEHRAIQVEGHFTGHQYVIAHRHSKLAQRMQYICGDMTDGGILHFHDWTVPPEEEVLAAKLVLEHREPWLRNEATCFGALLRGGRWSDVLKNPFGGVGDGTRSSHFVTTIGQSLFSVLGRNSNGERNS